MSYWVICLGKFKSQRDDYMMPDTNCSHCSAKVSLRKTQITKRWCRIPKTVNANHKERGDKILQRSQSNEHGASGWSGKLCLLSLRKDHTVASTSSSSSSNQNKKSNSYNDETCSNQPLRYYFADKFFCQKSSCGLGVPHPWIPPCWVFNDDHG